MTTTSPDLEREVTIAKLAAVAAVVFARRNPESDELDLASYEAGTRDALTQAWALREAAQAWTDLLARGLETANLPRLGALAEQSRLALVSFEATP